MNRITKTLSFLALSAAILVPAIAEAHPQPRGVHPHRVCHIDRHHHRVCHLVR